MAGPYTLSADLRFSVQLPEADRPVAGHLTGSGRRLELHLDEPLVFAGRGDARLVCRVGAALAGQGLVVAVVQDGRTLVELGARAPWWQRVVTRAPYLRVAGFRGALTGLRGSARGGAATLPGRALVPPGTLLPLVPTFGMGPRGISTTHDPRRGGHPRLVLTVNNRRVPDGGVVHPLRSHVTTIGSAADCDIRLPDVAPLQAEVHHREDDEIVLVDRAGDGSTRVHGAPVRERVLRTGSRVELGGWTFAYRRAEYADHGRPFGGRVGGEIGHQRSQPDLRPRLTPVP